MPEALRIASYACTGAPSAAPDVDPGRAAPQHVTVDPQRAGVERLQLLTPALDAAGLQLHWGAAVPQHVTVDPPGHLGRPSASPLGIVVFDNLF